MAQIGAYKGCAAFIRAARKAGFGGSLCNLSFVGTQALADELGKDGAGGGGDQPGDALPLQHHDTDLARVRTVHRRGAEGRRRRHGQLTSIEGYIAAKVLAEGFKHAGRNPGRDALVTALEPLQRWHLGGLSCSFGPRDRAGSSFVELSMLTGDGKVRR